MFGLFSLASVRWLSMFVDKGEELIRRKEEIIDKF